MSIDYVALDRAMGGNSEEPILGTTEIDPQTGLTLSEKDIDAIRSRMKYGSPLEVFPGSVPKSTLRILGDQGYYPQHGDEYTRRQLAREQSSFGQFANAMNQAIVGEVIGGTMEGIGYMLDLKQYGNLIRGEEEDFGNVLSDVGKALKTWTREVSPVHVAPGAKEFDPGNWAWWMSNAPSIASTLSLMIPSAGVVRGVGALGKLIGVAGKMGQKAKWMTTGISQAVVSRHMENLMEASGVYEERFDYGKNMGMSDKEAKKFASVAASNTYSKQWAMLLQDIPQYLLLNKLGGVGKNVRSSKLAAAMGMAPGKYFGAKGVAIARDVVGEAGEEMYQYLVNEQSKLMAMKSVDPKINTSLGRVWQDHYDSGEMKTAALFGALGAGVMQVGFAGFNAKAIQASNKVRIQELTNRSKIFETAYKEYQDALDSNNPIQQRQALSNLEIALATAAEAVGNEKHLIDDIKRMTNDPNDEIFERYGIDAEQGTILKDNPEIANRMESTVKRVRQLRDTFGREVNENRKIKKEDQGKFTQLMIYNQLMLERAKEEQKILEQELNTVYSKEDGKFNELTPQGQTVRKLQHQITAISDPTGKKDVSGENKIGTLDVLRKRLVERERQLSEEEKAILEYNIKAQELLLETNKGQLIEAEKLYTKEDRTKDESIAIVDEELNQLLSHQRRVRWADATVEDLEGSLKLFKEGKIPGEVDEDVDDASTDKYDPKSDIKVDSFVEYIDEEGNVQRGRVTALKLAETDSEGKPVGREGESVNNIYTVQPVDDKENPIGEPIEGMSGLDLTLSKKQENYDETDDTIDTLDQDVSTDDVTFTRKNPGNRGTISPITNLSYSEDRGGKVVSRNEELHKTISDPTTSYAESEAEYYFTSDNTYLQTLKTSLNKRIKELSDNQKKTASEKKELTALRKVNPLFNKLMKGEFLTQKEAEIFVSANKNLPIGNVIDTIPISVNVTIEDTKYGEKGGLYLHSAGFPYIKIPPSIIDKMRKDPEARNVYLNQKVTEARTIRNSILLHTLTGQRLYTTNLKVGRGVPNSLPTNISKDKRKKNIAEALGVLANKIKFGITKSLSHQPYYATMYVGENSQAPGNVRYNTAGNLFIFTTDTINGKQYALKANSSRIDLEHADIILDAFQLIGYQEHKKRKTAFAKYKDDSKIAKNTRYKISWKKGYDRVTGILPAELLDLLIAHGRNLTDPRVSKRKRDISNRHKRELLNKTLYHEATKNTAILYYGFNPETEEPYQINLADLHDIDAKRVHFAEWVVENKNYAAHIHKRGNEETGGVNIELNGGLLNNRPFTIGERKETQLIRKKGEGYNEFLINNMLYTIDAEQNELNGTLFKDPTLNLNIQRDGDKLNLKTKSKPVQKQASEKVRDEQPQPKIEAEKSEGQKQEEKKPSVKTKEEFDATIAKLEAERDVLLEKITDPAERKKIQSRYGARIRKARALRKVEEERQTTTAFLYFDAIDPATRTLVPDTRNLSDPSQTRKANYAIRDLGKGRGELYLNVEGIPQRMISDRDVYLDPLFEIEVIGAESDTITVTKRPIVKKFKGKWQVVTKGKATLSKGQPQVKQVEQKVEKVGPTKIESLEKKREKEVEKKDKLSFSIRDAATFEKSADTVGGKKVLNKLLSGKMMVPTITLPYNEEEKIKVGHTIRLRDEDGRVVVVRITSDFEGGGAWLNELLEYFAFGELKDRGILSDKELDELTDLSSDDKRYIELAAKVWSVFSGRTTQEFKKLHGTEDYVIYNVEVLGQLKADAIQQDIEFKEEPVAKKPNPLDDIDRGFEFAMEAKEEGSQKKMNLEKELAWVLEKVGLDNVETVSRILRIADTGRRAWALYSHDAVLLDEAAVEGVLYHEAFHRVSFGYLTKVEREALHRTARQVYKMEDATNKEIEERLADEFREFVLLQEIEDKPTLPKGIRGVFQRLYNWIKSVFTRENKLRENDIDRMFKQIYAGKYANNEVLEENLKNIKPGEYAMIVGGKQFNTITSSKQRKDVVKMLARMALETSGIKDLNVIRNKDKIKIKPFFDWLNESIKNFETIKQDTPEKQARADQIKAVYKEVQANKAIFWDMMLDYFADIGIKSKNAQLSELDIYQLEENQEVVGEIDYDKRSSYEISIKDNALSSVRFLVDSLHTSATIDPTTGLQPTVSGNEVWSSLLLHLNAFEDIQDMITELKVLATDNLDMPWYRELASKLEEGSDNLRNQFLRTFNVWKHDFITFNFFNTRQGVKWNLFSNSSKELARNITLSWDEQFYFDEKLVSTLTSSRRKPHADTFIELEESYTELVDLVNEDVMEGNVDNKHTQKHIGTLVNLLNTIHIAVDTKTINYLLNEFYDDSLTIERLYTMLTNDIKDVLGRTSLLYEEAVRKETKEDEDIEPVLGMFMKIPMLFTSERSLSKGYAMAHPELQENVVLGAEGNKYFTYAENNMATDIVRKLKKDGDYLATRRGLLNNKHSRVLKYLSDDINIREAFYLKTFSALTGKDRGRNYKQVTPLEEYLIRFNALENGLMPVAIMANRKQHYYMSGIPLLEEVTKTIKVVNNRIELEYSDETLDLFYGYFLDEKERVIYAREIRNDYQSEETPKERKEEIYQTLVKNYHYEGDIDLNKGNAYHFQHFKEFNNKTDKELSELTTKEVKGVITGMLNDLFEKEYNYAHKIGAISKVGLDLSFDALFSVKGSELDAVSEEDTHQRDAVVQVLSDMMINNMMSTIESEKVLFADPAFFAKNKNSEFDVSEDMYKRWFGVGSTGARLAKNTEMHPDTTFNVATFNTQKFKSKHYEVIHARHKELYIEAGLTEKEAEKRATDVLDALTKVDPTDGTMLISPAMFRSISDRLGQWSDEKETAYKLLMSDKELDPKEELKAAGVVLQPLKTVYIGKQAFNNMDLVIYDKMSMVTLFRKQVKNTPLEDVLDRMEAVGFYKGQEEIHAFKYDSATKLGGRPGVDFFTDNDNRNKVVDLSNVVIHRQLFDNLKHQVVTDVHDVERQLVGSQAYKVISSNIQKEQEYGEYGNGQQILDDMTASREAISTIGVDRVKARLGIRGTKINDRRFIAMLANDAKQAKKSFDFISALTIDDKTGEPYLELDSFMDRQWVYARIMSIIGKETVNLEMPGNQLIQVSDYGKASYDMDLGYSIPDEAGSPLEMEVRVSTALFKHVIPNYDKLIHNQRVEFLKEEFKLIGYRVPVQGQNSTVRLKVVDFLREQAGDVIQLPLEFTALTGSDFDIDKLFIMSYNYDKGARHANRIEKVKFSEGTSQNAIDARYGQKVVELFHIYRNNPEVIGEDIVTLLDEYKRVIGTLKDHRTETYTELEAAQEVATFIRKQLEKDPNNKELQNELLSTEGYITSLEEDGRDWEWDIQGLKDAGLVDKASVLIEAGVLLEKEAFAELPIEQQNTREANENRMLDIFNAVLGDPKHFLQTSTPLGAVTGKLKAKAEKVSKAYGEQKELLSLETTTSCFQSSIRNIFIGADAGIGAFALNNAHHSLTQHADFGIKSDLKFGLKDETQDIIWFNKINSQDDVNIMDWLSAMIDAHVDAVKDPYIMRLNVNNVTLNVVSTMLRVGVGENTFNFISQPIIREYAQEFTNATGRITRDEITEEARRKTHEFAITKIKERWAEYMGISPGDFENTTTLETVLKETPLEVAIEHAQDWRTWSKDKQIKYVTRQLSILEYFDKIHTVSKKLNRVVMASRIDTKKYGSNPIQIRHFLNSILSLEKSRDFIHLDKLINSEGKKVEGGTMLPVLFKNSALLGLNIMADKSVYGSHGFGILVGNILDNMMSGFNADENTIRDVMQETFSVLASDFFADVEEGMGVNRGVLKKMLDSKNKNNLFEQLRNIRKESHPFHKDLKDNKFLNMITVDYNSNFFYKWYLRTPFHTFDDRWETDDYIEDFRALSQHESADVRQLASMLYVYSFYTTGWWQRRHSIHGYLPASMNKELQLKDGRVVSFNDFIKKLRRNLTDQEWALAKANDVKRNVLKNNWYNSRLVPSLGLGSGMFEEVVVGDQTIGYILDTSDESEKSEYYLGKNKDNQPVYIPYITIVSDDEAFSTLIEYVGYNARTKKPIYRTVPRKGYSEIGTGFKEYGLTEDMSLFNKNNIPFYTEEQFKKVLDNDFDTQYVPTVLQNVVKRSGTQDAFYRDFTRMESEYEIDGVKVERMDFEDGSGGRIMRPEFKGKSTMDLVLEGRRTATSRTYILDVKEGDQVLFEDRFGRRALVEVTKAPYKASEITSEEWSAMEGWAESVYKPNLYQYQFKLLAGTSTADALTSYERPLKIFTDGSSVQNKGIVGYGAYFEFANEQYKLSGNTVDVNGILDKYKKDFTVEDLLKVSKNPAPTMELMGILETLRKFSNTSEHIYILTDQENNVNYEGIWENTFVNEHIPSAKEKVNGKRTKSTKPNTTGTSPWLEYLVPEIVKQVEKIKANGGSVRFQWIPGHIDEAAVNKYPHAFADSEGAVSGDIVDQYQRGNDNADILAKSTESNFKRLFAPRKESIEMLRAKAEEKYSERSVSGNEIC